MQIFELEKNTGLDRATIRYYEKEGFITPKRLENGYRDYSADDQNHLLKIRLLRQLGMSLDKIRELQQGSTDFYAAMTEQIRALDGQIQSATKAKTVCNEMRNTCSSYDTLDAGYYLSMLSEPSAPAVPEKNDPFREQSAQEGYHPVRRLVARLLDYQLIRVALYTLIFIVLKIRPHTEVVANQITYVTIFLAVPLMALMLRIFGTTPGKWIMGIEITHITGVRLGFFQSLAREWSVLRYGYGFGIPIWSHWRQFKSYKLTTERKRMPWDTEVESEYQYRPWTKWKKMQLALILLLIIVISVLGALQLSLPTHRGDLTIAQFAENYNDYYRRFIGKYHTTPLNDTGSFHTGISRDPESGLAEINSFLYETDGETLQEITYINEWTGFYKRKPLQQEVYLAAFTVVMSQEGSSYSDIEAFENLWNEHVTQQNAHFQYKNIEIKWDIKAINCEHNGSWYQAYINQNDARIEIYLEIVIH